VHRIGRTGRAGRSGRAISLVPGRELFQIRNIERFTNMRIQRGRIPTADEVVEARENVFIEKLRALLTGGEFQKHDQIVERLLEEGFSSTDIASALIHLLQTGEAAKPAPKTENYDRPERDERPPARFDDRRDRPSYRDDRGGDRGNFRDDRRPGNDQPRRFEDRPPRGAAPAPVLPATSFPSAHSDRSGSPLAAQPVRQSPCRAS